MDPAFYESIRDLQDDMFSFWTRQWQDSDVNKKTESKSKKSNDGQKKLKPPPVLKSTLATSAKTVNGVGSSHKCQGGTVLVAEPSDPLVKLVRTLRTVSIISPEKRLSCWKTVEVQITDIHVGNFCV